MSASDVVWSSEMKILAVDDDASIRELLPMILGKVGYDNVVVAASASEALSAVSEAEERFECFLLDIQMPQQSGVELCADIREIEAYSHVPIIMLTAMNERDFVEQAFQAGADDYLTKPFNISEVGLRIRQVTARNGQASRVEIAKPASIPAACSFENTVALQGVKGLLQPLAFSNYVRQLSRSGLQATLFHATSVSNARKLYETLSEADFKYAISHAADTILGVLSRYNALTTYLGKGVFLSSSTAMNTRPAIELESEIQGVLDEKNLVSEQDLPIDLDIAVGASVSPLSNGDIDFEDLKFRTTARVDMRIKEIIDAPRPIEIRRNVR
ncbi:response regulator transcription factor [Tateyamaria omphalii]|uniref:response regulator transcription factor n=1 Tax=Tateyamaria omphalii TaxID=299262 RepID=UPI001C98FF29|nr:response regulator transcription factor [Tateyamaria omphalii]MBY5932740.1 response regulator transcription factor [Tateyamaria omphalii]